MKFFPHQDVTVRDAGSRWSMRAAVFALLFAVGLSATVQAQQTPFTGTPIAIPGTWEVENFDNGGEGAAYHDNTPGNQGGQYRLTENVDIIPGPQGIGFVVNNFETGEWLEYTVNVQATGFYNIEILASNSNWTPVPAFRVEIEGRGDVTGTVAVPSTGSWSVFQWVGKNGIFLAAGQQVLRIVAVQQYFNLDSIRVTPGPTPAPYTGAPIPVPGTWEAENFDLGGEGVAYHDNVPGNAGGQYRTNEDVDLFITNDSSGGGYIIKNFETGEWLSYTISVPASGSYDVELRIATDASVPNRAYRLYVDGVDVTGRVDLPDTGGWTSYQWAGKRTVALTAGTHILKIVSEQQYFDFNQIRVLASAALPLNLLFWAGYEGTTSVVAPPYDCFGDSSRFNGCWQDMTGADQLDPKRTWPPKIWGSGATGRFQLIMDAQGVYATPQSVGNYMINRIETVTGHDGTPNNKALYTEIKKSGCIACGTGPQGSGATQDPYIAFPAITSPSQESDLYISYWLKHQPNFAELMEVGNPTSGWNWRVVFEWKTAGDYRVITSIKRDPYFNGGNLYWNIIGDNEANGGLPYQKFWEVNNTQVPVPVGQWLKFEVYWHRSTGNDGRVWMAVNGQVIINQDGPNIGINNAPINRIMMPNLYSSTSYPIYQWVDDVQIWQGFPSAALGDPWYDPPYAPH